MSLYDPILVGLSFTWQMTAETGGAIQSFSREVSRKFLEVFDAGVGYTTGFIAYDPKAEYNVEVIQTGSTGLILASPGVTLSLANTSTGNGVSSGGIYTRTVALSHRAEDFRKYTITATQYPAIA